MKKDVKLIRLFTGAVLFAAAYACGEESTAGLILSLCCMLVCGADVIFFALRSILRGEVFAETVLMALSSVTAACLGEAHEGAAVLLFYGIGEYFQDKAEEKSRKTFEKLNAGVPPSEKTARTERFMAAFARIYTPIVVALAVVVAFLPPVCGAEGTLSEWVRRGLTLLVTACPCAIVASVPLAFLCARSALLKKGVTVSGSYGLQYIAANAVKIEKTAHGYAIFDWKSPVLLAESEKAAAAAVKRAKSVRAVITENVILFCVVKAAVAVCSVFGITTGLWLAVISDAGLLIVAVLNSLRMMKRIKK